MAIEVDELGHNDRNNYYEIKREIQIEKVLNCVFIRANLDAADFNINKLNDQIFKHIIERKQSPKDEDNQIKYGLIKVVNFIIILLKIF